MQKNGEFRVVERLWVCVVAVNKVQALKGAGEGRKMSRGLLQSRKDATSVADKVEGGSAVSGVGDYKHKGDAG